MATISNVHMIALGINEVRAGNAIVEGGIAHIAEGICEAWFTPLRWSYGKGDDEVSGCVNLGDMFKGRHNTKGEADSKFLPAMYRAVAESFGIDGEMTSADKMAFQRGFSIAAARHAGAPVKFVDETVERKGRSVKVRAVEIPASYAFKLQADDGSLTDVAKDAVARIKSNLELEGKDVPEDAELLKRAGNLKVKCVGGKHPVFGKRPSSTEIANTLREVATDAGIMPAPKSRNGSARADKFGEALEYVGKCIELLDDDESDFAPSDVIDGKLRALAERIAAYFAK
jgi:hypothetical protein